MLFFQILAILIQIGVPVFLFFWILKKWKIDSGLIYAGAAAFLGSQLIHLPLNWYLANVGLLDGVGLVTLLILSFTAGLCEEPARYFVLKRWWPKSKTHKEAIAFGVGHGGIESLGVGLLSIFSVMNFWNIKNGGVIPGITPEDLIAARDQIEASLAMPFWLQLAGGLERIFAIVFHLSAACLVMLAIAKRKPMFVWLAILWHTLFNFVGLLVLFRMGGAGEANAIIYSELTLFVLMIPAIFIIKTVGRRLKQNQY